MKFYKFSNKLNNEEGSVIVTVALLMTVILAIFAIIFDSGNMYSKTSILQNSLDSIALAATQELAQELPDWEGVVKTAEDYEDSLNDINTFGKITAIKQETNINGKIIGVTVEGDTNNIDFIISNLVNSDLAITIPRSATAKLQTVSGLSGVLPVGIDREAFDSCNIGDTVTLKVGYNLDGSGWRGIIDIDETGNNSGDYYRSVMINGSAKKVIVGEEKNKVEGNKVGPTQQAIEGLKDRIGDDEPSIIVIYDIVDDKKIRIVGFAAVIISDITSTGQDSIVTGEYVKTLIADEVETSEVTDYGVYAVKLTN